MPKHEPILYLGQRPYYRRTLDTGLVRIYFRDRLGAEATIDCIPAVAEQFKKGHTYTLQFTHEAELVELSRSHGSSSSCRAP